MLSNVSWYIFSITRKRVFIRHRFGTYRMQQQLALWLSSYIILRDLLCCLLVFQTSQIFSIHRMC